MPNRSATKPAPRKFGYYERVDEIILSKLAHAGADGNTMRDLAPFVYGLIPPEVCVQVARRRIRAMKKRYAMRGVEHLTLEQEIKRGVKILVTRRLWCLRAKGLVSNIPVTGQESWWRLIRYGRVRPKLVGHAHRRVS